MCFSSEMDVMEIMNLCDSDSFGTKSHYNFVTGSRGVQMTYNNEIQLQRKNASANRPQVTSYDSGYEHSIEHLMEVRLLMQESEEEPIPVHNLRTMVARA
jgi:hypothetical protein